MDCRKTYLITKILSVILFVLTFFVILGFIAPLINFSIFLKLGSEKLVEAFIRGVLALIVCLGGGIGLWLLKRWAVYLVGISGSIVVLLIVFKIIFIQFNIDDLILLIPGILSVYILRNRKCFETKN